jgi:hypothetical protein
LVPIATAFCADATAPAPFAVLLSDAASAFAPIAVLFSPAAFAAYPIAVAAAPDATAAAGEVPLLPGVALLSVAVCDAFVLLGVWAGGVVADC